MNNMIKIIGLERIYLLRQLSYYFKLFLKYSTPKKIANLLRCEYELLTKKTRLKSAPYMAKIEPTNLCNLDCKFCGGKNANYGDGFMSLENYKVMFDQLKDYLYFCVLELHGEPLLHKDICRFIEYAHKNKVSTYISTNLNYLNENLVEGLITSGLDLLTVSLDGASQETYSKYRRNGDFNLVKNNLKKLVEQKRKLKSKTPVIQLQFIVFNYNENEIEKIKTLAREIGVDSLKIKPGFVTDSKWLPKKEEYRSRQYRNARKRKTCWWLWRGIVVSWNGLIFPCCMKIYTKPYMFDVPYGNMLKERFLDIWNNDIYVNSRKCFSSKSKVDSICYGCEIPNGSIHG